MQETMVAVWNKCALYDASKGAASSWIFAIARNQRIDAYRRDRRPEFDLDDPALVADPDPLADRAMETAQIGRSIRGALKDLPDGPGRSAAPAYYEDKSQTEIADALKLPLGTVKSRMRLAFAKLRHSLSGELS